MKAFYFLICAILFTACTNPEYGELGDADGLFAFLQNNEFVMIETQSPSNGYHKKDVVFREGSVMKFSGGISLSSTELATLDSFVKSVNSRTISNDGCTNYGHLTITKNFTDGSIRRYRGAFDWCNLDEQAILIDVLGN